MKSKSLVHILLGLFALLLVSQPAEADPITIFSDSPLYRTPETISPAPAGFGAFGGQYFIPDFNRGQRNGNIWVVPTAGGPPSSFATNPDIVARGGLFLPEDGWGAHSGSFLVAGPVVDGTFAGSRIYTFAPDGSRTLFVQLLEDDGFAQPRIVPEGFGSIGGQLVVANTFNNNVLAIDPAGTVSVLADTPIETFGLAFAPEGFGSFGDQLFASSASDGRIVAIAPDGSVTPFAEIALQPGQTSLFQMEFAPPGFLAGFGELLFVSVRGSAQGGGTLGDLVALGSDGQIVARLRTDLGLEKFDPRGLYFIDNENLLVSDASDPILLITPGALQVVPEPSTFVLAAFGLAGLVAFYRGGQKRHA